MSSLLVVVNSQLFLAQFVHLSRKRGKVAAVTSSGHWGEARLRLSIAVGGQGTRERGGAAVVNRGGPALHPKRGGGSYSQP